MTMQLRGWIEPDVVRDDGKGKGVGWAEMDRRRERQGEDGWVAVTVMEG